MAKAKKKQPDEPPIFPPETETVPLPGDGAPDEPPAFPPEVQTSRPEGGGWPEGETLPEPEPVPGTPDARDDGAADAAAGYAKDDLDDDDFADADEGGGDAGAGEAETGGTVPRICCRCRRKCFYRGALYKPGQRAWFPADAIPPHFRRNDGDAGRGRGARIAPPFQSPPSSFRLPERPLYPSVRFAGIQGVA
jgi:hypothetical protein